MYWMWTPVTCHKQSDVNGTKGLLTCGFWKRKTPATRRCCRTIEEQRKYPVKCCIVCGTNACTNCLHLKQQENVHLLDDGF